MAIKISIKYTDNDIVLLPCPSKAKNNMCGLVSRPYLETDGVSKVCFIVDIRL